jgi:DDE_Tnp_1-associated
VQGDVSAEGGAASGRGGAMAACDDYVDIVLWGKTHLAFLQRLQEYHFGVPCADWLRVVMNRIGPDLFACCFMSFVADHLPKAVGQIAIVLRQAQEERRSKSSGDVTSHRAN